MLRGVVISPQGSWDDGLVGRVQVAVLKAWPAWGLAPELGLEVALARAGPAKHKGGSRTENSLGWIWSRKTLDKECNWCDEWSQGWCFLGRRKMCLPCRGTNRELSRNGEV